MKIKFTCVSVALLLSYGAFTLSCGDDDNVIDYTTKTVPDDNKDENKTLDENSGLKEYLDRDKHPGFKVSGALDVGEFHNNTNDIRTIVAHNFDEIVAGNAMKYASCVNWNGDLNFDRVKQFCEDAKASGLSIYGHTLTWHSQQQPQYLLGLMTDNMSADDRRQVLTVAMEKWISGIMTATNGFVKAWDLCNEPLSDGDNDKDGIYDLQDYENANMDPTSVQSGVFYWQYYMGDLEYVRTAVALARKHFKGKAKDLKLFINDYNLESDWDDNGKVKSLVKWIEKWEADGVTKIDGIGTQMHISCYENADIQKSIEDHIVKMFEIMAASGKLCRISELDMGYVRGDQRWGVSSLKTEEVTAKEHQRMADFYHFIVKKYLEIIPVEQQYGICQWCLTDAPAKSGWRGGEPVGFWTENFTAKKKTFYGFADGLAEK